MHTSLLFTTIKLDEYYPCPFSFLLFISLLSVLLLSTSPFFISSKSYFAFHCILSAKNLFITLKSLIENFNFFHINMRAHFPKYYYLHFIISHPFYFILFYFHQKTTAEQQLTDYESSSNNQIKVLCTVHDSTWLLPPTPYHFLLSTAGLLLWKRVHSRHDMMITMIKWQFIKIHDDIQEGISSTSSTLYTTQCSVELTIT